MSREERIKVLEEKVKQLDGHCINYEKQDCLTSVYHNLRNEKQILEETIQDLKKLYAQEILDILGGKE